MKSQVFTLKTGLFCALRFPEKKGERLLGDHWWEPAAVCECGTGEKNNFPLLCKVLSGAIPAVKRLAGEKNI